MMSATLMPKEILGSDRLDQMADMIFGDSDPAEVYATESPLKFTTVDGVDEMIMKIPFAEKGDIDLYKTKEDTVIVQVGSHRRNISLPLTLSKAKLLGAEMRDGTLVVKFQR